VNAPQPWWVTQPVAEVAAAILPLFTPSATSEHHAVKAIVGWLRTGTYKAPMAAGGARQLTAMFEEPDHRSVAEAIQALEHAALIMRVIDTAGGSNVGLTRRGMHALATGTARHHLGLVTD
jgi:hypothetical protein